MSSFVIFGAGGRGGRSVTAEAVGRGHTVTAVVREPDAHATLAGRGVELVRGDVTDPADVARRAEGHDVAVSTVYTPSVAAEDLYVGAATALLDGLARAGVGRLIVVGIAATLVTAAGGRTMDAPDFPAAYLDVCRGHAAGLAVLETSDSALDWLVMNPAGDFDHDAGRTGGYRIDGEPILAGTPAAGLISYPDFAAAVVDEIETPRRHRRQIGVVAVP